MNMAMVVALLVKFGNLDKETAEKICRPLELGNLPTDYKDALKRIDEALKD